jgi:hypothetical protein
MEHIQHSRGGLLALLARGIGPADTKLATGVTIAECDGLHAVVKCRNTGSVVGVECSRGIVRITGAASLKPRSEQCYI